jgi:hypothetical protein
VRGWTRSPWFRRRLICNGSFPSCADCRLPGSSGHPSSLSERNGLQAPHPPALATVEAPLAADIVGCPGERVNDGPPDGRSWDKASMLRSSAKQRNVWTGCNTVEHRGTMTAVASEPDINDLTQWATFVLEAERQYRNALRQLRPLRGRAADNSVHSLPTFSQDRQERRPWAAHDEPGGQCWHQFNTAFRIGCPG